MAVLTPARLRELWRYYQAGIVNAVFGFSLYALLVWLGLNLFVAQLLAHCIGVAFNYFTYTRHVFRDSPRAPGRFLLSYALNYLTGLAVLAVASLFIRSPYVAGFVALVANSMVNYVVLRFLVFKPAA